MQKDFILNQLKEAAAKAKVYIAQLEAGEHFSHDEAVEFLGQVEKMYRNLSVYEHSLKNTELAGDFNVHLKIMQTVTNIESSGTTEKITEPEVEIKQEAPPEIKKEEDVILKAIELSINNKFRIANELFAQSQVELQAALQQLNTITTQEDASRYLDSLKHIYKWKDENPLVKSFYALVQKRFS
ncbi:MAG: hypothetical protein ACXVPN_06670 [Bacteroidia bacterium]